jgi:hypothetical protein
MHAIGDRRFPADVESTKRQLGHVSRPRHEREDGTGRIGGTLALAAVLRGPGANLAEVLAVAAIAPRLRRATTNDRACDDREVVFRHPFNGDARASATTQRIASSIKWRQCSSPRTAQYDQHRRWLAGRVFGHGWLISAPQWFVADPGDTSKSLRRPFAECP